MIDSLSGILWDIDIIINVLHVHILVVYINEAGRIRP